MNHAGNAREVLERVVGLLTQAEEGLWRRADAPNRLPGLPALALGTELARGQVAELIAGLPNAGEEAALAGLPRLAVVVEPGRALERAVTALGDLVPCQDLPGASVLLVELHDLVREARSLGL